MSILLTENTHHNLKQNDIKMCTVPLGLSIGEDWKDAKCFVVASISVHAAGLVPRTV